jgi:hypothetical protein
VPKQAASPTHSSKHRSSIGGRGTALGHRSSSDADYLQTLQQVQGLEAVFHSQNPSATPGAGTAGAAGAGAPKQHSARSPHHGAVSLTTPSPGPWFGPSLDTPLPPATTSLPLPPPGGSNAAAAAGSSGAQTPGMAAMAAVATAGVNPLLTNLPSSMKWGSGKAGASALQRRLSGGVESIPHRLTSIAEVHETQCP